MFIREMISFGNWTDITLMEYRFPDEIVKEI